MIVDDEITTNDVRRSDVFSELKLPKEKVIFAANYEDAFQIILKEQNIATCFLDSRIPRNSYEPCDYSNSDRRGIDLIPAINKYLKYTSIYIYSAYVTEDFLREEAQEFNNIVAFFGKANSKLDKYQLRLSGTQRWLALQKFEYLLPNDKLSIFLFEETNKLNKLFTRTTEDIINIGKTLNKVKERLEHGQFLTWLETEFKMSDRTAARMMKVAQKFELDTVSNLSILPSALYELSTISATDAAVDEAMARAKQGETITKKLAKAIKNKHLQKKENLPTTTKRTRESKTSQNLSESETTVRETSASKPQTEPNTRLSSQKEQIVKVVRQQNLWQLGEHLLFCGDPNSRDFLKQLPNKISLNLAFPPNIDWKFSYSHQIESHLSFYSKYQEDMDLLLVEKAIEQIIKGTTNAEEIVSICYLPYPNLLQVVHKLGCCCFIAESDRDKCKAIVTHWEDLKQK
ncbi:DUF3102 domain-containing protein [Myxosarcina sp. GI1]|uniref:DUF3102 domain-containing protein n=1 Tax=Myxosarcina sp. GI1 TaxID=1541065 RepID=UPI001C106577|nr:DUF3102 domain-containing protein [Myxosarcina sp. GI1]